MSYTTIIMINCRVCARLTIWNSHLLLAVVIYFQVKSFFSNADICIAKKFSWSIDGVVLTNLCFYFFYFFIETSTKIQFNGLNKFVFFFYRNQYKNTI